MVYDSSSKLGYYRFPAIHDNTIVFTAEGDLWKADVAGGVAQRLTTHHGIESHAAISPDGTTVAFSAQYEGPTEVYTIPLSGGLPTRHTYEGEEALVVGWTPEGQILYSTKRFSTLPNTQLALFDLQASQHSMLPLHQASDGVFTPNGQRLFFTRLPFQGSHTKRYTGGTAQNIWKFAMGQDHGEAISLTANYPGTSKAPMWWEGRIYFVSDRDGTMNLWSMNEDGDDLLQHTRHKGWDVQSPNLHNGRIIYQLGADLYLLDISTGEDRLVPITLVSDFEQSHERWVKTPFSYLTASSLSPTGDRIALTARGRVFIFPIKQGRRVEVLPRHGVRYRDGQFWPDGKSILVRSDETGEVEFWKLPANGIGSGEALTSDSIVFRNAGIPSPDGKRIAYTDKDYQLWVFNVDEKTSTQIAVGEHYTFYGLSWSPDSQWLAYVERAENHYPQIKLYSLSSREIVALTSDRVDSYNPIWSPDGKWIYFLSDRYFASLVQHTWGPRQPGPYFDRTTKIYMIALQKGGRSPFQPMDEIYSAQQIAKQNPPTKENACMWNGSGDENDEEQIETDEESQNNSASTEEDTTPEAAEPAETKPQKPILQIDREGLASRIEEIPLAPRNYANLSTNGRFLFWTEIFDRHTAKKNLIALEIKSQDIMPQTLMADISSYTLSLDGKKLMIRKNRAIYVIDATAEPPKKWEPCKVDLRNWTFTIDPREEWRQMFIEAWRLERDYFYDRNLHGVNWQQLLDKHLPLVDRVTDRAELNDLTAHLIGELAALHTYTRSGDQRRGADWVGLASLGATLIRDPEAGGYRVKHIYCSDPDYPNALAPLARPNINVEEGDIIKAINGIPTLSVVHPAMLLKKQAGQQVLLQVKSATGEQFETIVHPISGRQETALRYDEWEYLSRLRVESESNDEIGYVHLRAMRAASYTEWVRNFYCVFNRSGLIVDVRNNRGGNIDSWILEKLMRKAWFYWKPRVGKPRWNMPYAFRGHMVVLCNEFTASDGEAFAEGFRRLGLGKIIGTRTWGGEIWLSYNTELVDNGMASAAEMGVYGPEGEWLIEGHGVEPDIVVDNLPHATFLGEDAQLDAAIQYLKEQIALHPVSVPDVPPYPDKSFDYE